MSKERLFYVKRNDSWHSFEFLEQRRNDPKWRQAFLEAEATLEQEDKKKKRRNFIILIVTVPALLLVLLVGLYFYGSADEEVVPKREVTLNSSSSISTTTEESTIDTSSIGQVLVTPWGEQVTVLRVLSNGERVIKESYSPSDLNNDGVLTYEELSEVEERANQGGYQQTPQQGHNNQHQQTPQQDQNNYQQQAPQQTEPSQSGNQHEPNSQQTPSSQQNNQPGQVEQQEDIIIYQSPTNGSPN